MDPNVVLAEIRSLILQQQSDPASAGEVAVLLAQAIEALDTWLSRGGFLPDAWN